MAAHASNKPKIGILALTLDFYETALPQLRPQREQWLQRDVLPSIRRFAEVVFDRAAYRQEDIQRQVQSFETAGVDAILVVLLTYSPSLLALPALRNTRLPILLWNTQELLAAGPSLSEKDIVDNHGVHGTQDLANVLLRNGVAFQYVTSHISDRNGLGEVEDFSIAAAAARRLRTARVGLVGYPFPGMGDFAVDTAYLAATLGCQWTALSVEEYVKRAASADAKAVATLTAEYRQAYDVASDVTDADLDVTARVEIALDGMVADYKLDALTYQFTAFGEDERTPTLPFVAASRLMARGIGFGGEGDLIAAAGTMMLNCLRAPASFSEIFTIDFAGNGVLMSHMGEANVAMARTDRKARLIVRSPIVRIRDRQLTLATAF